MIFKNKKSTLIYPPDVKPYPFQERLILRMLQDKSPNIYNACTMGLGKTVQAYIYMNTIEAKNLLVLCPSGLKLNWLTEGKRWFVHNHNPTAILNRKNFTDLLEKPKNYRPSPFIVSYQMLVRNADLMRYILHREWDGCISDEVDDVRNIDAKSTRLSAEIWDAIGKNMFLSGTPMPNGAIDLFPTLAQIVPGLTYISRRDVKLCTNFYKFAEKFTYIKTDRHGVHYRGIRNHEHLRKILHNKTQKFYFRRTIDQVIKDLPKMTMNIVELDLKTESVDKSKFEKEFSKFKAGKFKKFEKPPIMAKIRREAGLAIAHCEDAHKFCEKILLENEPIVIFCWHKDVVNILVQRFKKFKPVTVTGETSTKSKMEAVNKFQEGETNIIIGNLIALGKGWTLTRGRHAVFYEYDWLPKTILQAMGRLRRIGQKNAMFAHFFSCKNEFHMKIAKEVVRKQKNIRRVI